MNRQLPNRQTVRPSNFGQYVHTPTCGLNQQAQLIPSNCVRRELVPMSPSNVKHLYDPTPNNYEQRYQSKPVGTLYSHQFKETWPSGLGRQKVLGGGHYKVYPLTNRLVREVRDYTSYHHIRPVAKVEKAPVGAYLA